MASKSLLIIACKNRRDVWQENILTWAFVCFLGLGIASSAWAVPSVGKMRCVKLFRQKNYLAAGRCFEQLAKHLGPASKLSSLQRKQKGLWLRNAAVSLERAARTTKRVELAAYVRERAVVLLDLYQKEKLYENIVRSRSALALQVSIRKKIKSAPLALLCGDSRATFLLTGYKFQRRGVGSWNQNLRPGPYMLQIRYPDGQRRTYKFKLVPGKPLMRSYQAPPPLRVQVRKRPIPRRVAKLRSPARSIHRRPSPPITPKTGIPTLAWVGYIGGGVVLVIGGVMAGVGASMTSEAVRDWNAEGKNEEATTNKGNTGQSLLVSGVTIASGAALLVGVGLVAHLLTKKSPTPQTASLEASQRQPGKAILFKGVLK